MKQQTLTPKFARRMNLERTFALLLILAVLLALVGVQPTYAAGNITVDSLADTVANDGACTLREAITNANGDDQSGSTDCAAGNGTDTITFDSSVFSTAQIITLTSTLPTITSTIIISGPGEALLTVDGVGSYRVLQVDSDLSIADLTIANGRVSGGANNGAGVYVNGGVLTANDITFSGNNSGYYGGGIYSDGGSVSVTNGTFSGNISDGKGGAIYNSNGTLMVIDSTFSTNSTVYYGGGGIFNSGTLTVTGSTFTGNSSPADGGGGIYGEGGTLTITSSTFSGNTAGNTAGGGISQSGGTVTVSDSSFTGNTAGGGGGISMDSNGMLTLDSSTFSGNSAAIGAGIYNYHSDSTISSSTFTDNTADSGGGIYTDGGALSVTDSTFTDNTANSGGGILNHHSDSTISSSTFTDNTADSGGGIYTNGGALSVTDSTFTGNASGGGGGNGGGGISVNTTSDTSVTVSNSTFSGNSANAYGGAINARGTDSAVVQLTVNNNTFSANTAQYGAGIFTVKVSSFMMTNSTLSGNTASGAGGGIEFFSSIGTITNSTISGNTAPAYSGAGLLNVGILSLNNSIVAGNSDDCYDLDPITIQNSLIGDASCGVVSGVNGNLTGDPLLGALADNGGATQTMALLDGSPAIDTGDDTLCPTTDQRGVVRPQGLHCDIGAYEAEITNTAPVAEPGGPYLGAINTNIQFDGSASSDPEADALTYAWDFGDSASGTGAMPTHSYNAAGVYAVCLTVNDGALDSDPACTMAVVYDPSAGFVTGGGWIDSPVNSDYQYMQTGGKATFGFVSKYKKGANVPDGNTEFQFQAGNLSFKSSSYEWLVVAGNKAQFKGEGTINGQGSYQFMITADDDNPDTFRIKIWYEDVGEVVVYDNGSQQALGGGSIVVHKSK